MLMDMLSQWFCGRKQKKVDGRINNYNDLERILMTDTDDVDTNEMSIYEYDIILNIFILNCN